MSQYEVKELQPLDWSNYMDVSIDTVAKALGLKTFDCAIPQHWWDAFIEITGISPTGHVVWCYDNVSFGEPVAITREMSLLLLAFKNITARS